MNIGVAVVIVDVDQILLGKRLKPSGYGLYAVPGGKPEMHETFEQTCVREVLEECGITVNPIRLIAYKDTISAQDGSEWRTFFWGAEPVTRDVKNCEPEYCAGWEWHSIYDLPSNLWEMDVKLLAKIEDFVDR